MSNETTHSDLTALGDRLLGSWKVSGEAEGETSWEWMEGGFFLSQRGSFTGNGGSTSSHSSSDTIHGAAAIGTLPARRRMPTAFVAKARVPAD